MTLERFTACLAAYGSAWERGDPDAVVQIFAPAAAYVETPFSEPMRGHAAIRDYWIEGARDGQRDVKFHAQPAALIDGVGYAHWHATFIRIKTGGAVELDGMLAARFAADGRCSEFREWWHRRESSSA
jgi:ketosteroid isomerase-like protein